MGLFKQITKNKNTTTLTSSEKDKTKNANIDCGFPKPFMIINGKISKDDRFLNWCFNYYTKFLDGIENGIEPEECKRIIALEGLDKLPDSDYGDFRSIVFSERDMVGRASTKAVFATQLNINQQPQTFYVVTGTGEKGSEGSRLYFEAERFALSFLVAELRAMKEKPLS